jgi:hypothetical protein
MSTALNSQSETIKNSIIETADSALDINKKAVDSIKKNLTQKEIDDSITYTVKETFGKSVELAEDSIDSVINAYVKQVEWSVALNAKLIDSFKENYGSNPEKVLNLIYENFETSRQVTIKNTLEIIEYYNKHTNLAVNFNKKFADTIANQVEVLSHIQSKGLDKYKEWVSDWWKDVEKEVVTK